MKRILIIFLLFYAVQSRAQDTIPNAGFERWVNFGGWYDNPEYWFTSNNQIIMNVIKDTAAYSGRFAMTLINRGWASVSFKASDVTQLRTYAKSRMDNDTSAIKIVLMKNNIVLDSVLSIISSNYPIYESISINLPVTTPAFDSIEIKVTAGKLLNSYLTLDGFSLANTNRIAESAEEKFYLFPNPADNFLWIESDGGKTGSFFITDLSGRLMIADQLLAGKNRITLKPFSSGIYIVCIRCNGDMIYKKICKY